MSIEMSQSTRTVIARAAAVLATIALLFFFFFQRGYQKNPGYLSGDEPHYIMMTDSFVKDGDFNLKNDYQLHRSWAYYPAPDLYPQLSSLSDTKGPNWYPVHTIGLPLLIAVPYKVFGVLGARLLMILLQLSAVALFYLILRRYITNKLRRRLGMVVLLTCALFWQNLGALFPDLIMVTFFEAAILLFGSELRLANAALGLVTVFAAVIHSKGIVLLVPIFLCNVWWLIKRHGFRGWARRYWASALIVSVGALSSTYFLYSHYGVLSPTQLYGKHSQLFSANPLINLVASLTDRSKGLFVYFPLLLVCLPYAWKMLKDWWEQTRIIAGKKLHNLTKEQILLTGFTVSIFGFLVTVLTFDDWSGSTAPNGRALLPVIFLIIFTVSRYADLQNRLQLTLLGALVTLDTCLSWLSITDFKYYMTVGVNSFWVDRFHPLVHLPLFQLTASNGDRLATPRGVEILALVLVLNIALIVLYRYKIRFEKRIR